jgi:nucleotide-binding universal stress UspA family protein
MVKKVKRIGVGVDLDGDDPSFAAQTAAALARRTGAALDLIHVVHLPPLYSQVLSPIQSQVGDPGAVVRRILEKLQALAASPLFAGLQVSCHAPVGTPHAALVECCREQGDDLIVIGAHRRGAVARLLLGRTGERVLRHAPVPVLAARAPLAEKPRVILAATDFSLGSRGALDEALALARTWEARVVMVHVMEPVAHLYGWAADLAGGDVYLAEPRELEPEWQKLLAELDTKGVVCEHRTEKGEPALVIPALAKSLSADLVVVGTHGRSAIAHALLGSVAEGVARNAETSVLTVPSKAAPVAI